VQLRSNWQSRRRSEVGEYIAEHGRDVTDRFIKGPPGKANSATSSRPAQASTQPALQPSNNPPSRPAAILATASVLAILIGIAGAPPFLLAPAITVIVGVALFHSWLWRRTPNGWAIGGIVIATPLVALGAHLVFERGSPADSPSHAVTVKAAPERNPVGQLESGNIVRVARARLFADPIKAPIGAQLTIAVRISNDGPDDVDLIEANAVLPAYAARLIAFEVFVVGPGVRLPVSDGATVRVTDGAACAFYVEDSTGLYTADWGLLQRLPNGIRTDLGIVAGPDAAPVAAIHLVAFKVSLEQMPLGTPCPS